MFMSQSAWHQVQSTKKAVSSIWVIKNCLTYIKDFWMYTTTIWRGILTFLEFLYYFYMLKIKISELRKGRRRQYQFTIHAVTVKKKIRISQFDDGHNEWWWPVGAIHLHKIYLFSPLVAANFISDISTKWNENVYKNYGSDHIFLFCVSYSIRLDSFFLSAVYWLFGDIKLTFLLHIIFSFFARHLEAPLSV